MLNFPFDHLIYWLAMISAVTGLYILMAFDNLIKKMIGLNIFQTAIFFIFILVAYVENSAPPILTDIAQTYSNPLPHVLILTAIVVAVATTALGLAFTVRINSVWHTLDEEDLNS